MSSDQWRQSQDIKLGLNLGAAARIQLQFLAQVHTNPWLFDPPVLEKSLKRYEFCWLPLLEIASASTSFQPIPPLDCAWIWHCHRLNPVQYAKDCSTLFGRVIDAPLREETQSDESTAKLWSTNFPLEPYTFDLRNFSMAYEQQDRPKISYDLMQAVFRQKNFYYQVCEPHYLEECFLDVAVKRYKAFLHLIRFNQNEHGFFVPTYDIDLIWHAHQLSPVRYHVDTSQILGKVLEHDDTDSNRDPGGKIDAGFSTTATLWEKTYGIPYEKAGCMYRGIPSTSIVRQTLGGQDKLHQLRSSSWQKWLRVQEYQVTTRKVMKVNMVLQGTKEILSRTSDIFVRLKLLEGYKSLKLDTPKTFLQSEQKHTWSFEVEVSTKGVELELRSRRHGIQRIFGNSDKLADAKTITWEEILRSENLVISRRLPLAAFSLFLEAFISVTPPVCGPYLLRSFRARPTGDDGASTSGSTRKGLWLSRTVLDHHNKEIFVIRSRYKKGGFWSFQTLAETEKVVQIHLGGWNYSSKHEDSGTVPGEVVAHARQLSASADLRKWQFSLQDGLVVSIRKDNSDPQWNLRPHFDVEGSPECPVVLLSGRKLQFAAEGSTEKEEAGFVTVVRYTRDTPNGEATALFNWKSGAMHISYNESVLLVLLLSTTISISISELLGKKIKYNNKPGRQRDVRKMDDWSAIAGDAIGTVISELVPWWVELGTHYGETGAGCGAGQCGVGGGGACGGGCGGGGGGGGCGGGGAGCGGGGGGGGGGCGGGGGGGGS